MKVRTSTVTTEEQLQEVVDAYARFDELVFDVETRGQYRNRPERAEVAWISLAGPGRSDVIPIGHPHGRLIKAAYEKRTMRLGPDGKALLTTGEDGKGHRSFDIERFPAVFGERPTQLWPSVVFEALEPLFFSERRKIGHNVRFDVTAVAKYYGDKVPPPPYGDTIVLHHLLNERRGAYNLKDLTKKVFGFEYEDGNIGKKGIDLFAFNTVAKYAKADARWTWLLWHDYFPLLAKRGLAGVFRFEMDVCEALIYMEKEGAPVDFVAMRELEGRVRERTEEITLELHRIAGKVWNLDAPASKGWFVYTVRKHKARHVTQKKKQASTTAEHLGEYASTDPAVATLVEYADLQKLLGTYLEGMLTRLVEGRLHPSFLQAGTTTGRFSCANPNLQNLPRHQEERKEFSVRSFFIAPPKHRLIVADYSQIELRLMAHFSRDPGLMKIFIDKLDAHGATAAMILRIPFDSVTPEQRVLYGKNVNFMIGYGGGPRRLNVMTGLPMEECKKILADHRSAFPRYYRWKDNVLGKARTMHPPQVKTYIGRIRRLPELCAGDNMVRWAAERQAISAVVQGSAADVIKLAMVRLHRACEGTSIQQILTVHDELVTVAPNGQEDKALALVIEAMEGAVSLRVPLTVDAKICDRWSDGK